jgi:uncharacterized protein YraI
MSAASAAADPAVVDSKLNLRSGPGPAFNVIAVMPPGTKLEVQTCGEEWCRVAFGRRTGYVNKALLRSGVDSYASAAPRPTPEPKPTLTGPTIWQWRNEQWRNEHWRQLDWHNRLNSR